MTAKEVLRVLQITRQTLTKYVKEGKLKVTVKGNGRYDYDADSVYKMLNKDMERKTYLYARVSTAKQKKDLEHQVQLLKKFCFQNGYSRVLALGLAAGVIGQVVNILATLKGGSVVGIPTELPRQALHSHKLEFYHPITNEKMTFFAPIPSDMADFWNNLSV